MNDEFVIDKTSLTGSEGHELIKYYLEFNKHQDVIDNMSFDEIKRLSAFLSEYIKKEGGEA